MATVRIMPVGSLRRRSVGHAASLGSTDSSVHRSDNGVVGRIAPHQRRPRPLRPVRISTGGRDGDAAAETRLSASRSTHTLLASPVILIRVLLVSVAALLARIAEP